MEYGVVTGRGLHELQAEVNKHLSWGWVPQGGVAVEPASLSVFVEGSRRRFVNKYLQAMVRSVPAGEEATRDVFYDPEWRETENVQEDDA